MGKIFDLDNPIWSFLGKLSDVFILTFFWILTSIPIVTIGASTTALYDCTLKLSVDKEGYIVKSFLKSFKSNFRQATIIWLIVLLIGLILYFDFIWCIATGGTLGKSMLIVFAFSTILFAMVASYVFPLIARCNASIKNILLWSFVMSIRNIHWSSLILGCLIAFLMIGYLAFWPIFLFGMGLLAYTQSFLFNKVFLKYNLQLKD